MAANLRLDLSEISEKQDQFFKAKRRFVAYGGARGGGKSWAVRYKAIMLALYYPGIKILFLRRTYKDLERNHVRELVPILKGFAKYHRQEKYFEFPNGSILEMGYCAAESDAEQYQGVEYDIIFFDEATQFTFEQFTKIYPSARGANAFPHRTYLTCNPGGIGHAWVKRLFIDKTYLENENPDEYEFIQALAYDNKALLTRDPEYIAKVLDTLPPPLRAAWRDGDWNIFEGQVFTEWRNNPDGYETRNLTHVIKPFEIPKHWRRYRSFDFGYSRPFAVQWWAVDTDGRVYLYRQLYGCTDTPNTGVKWEPRKIAREIKAIEDKYEKGNTIIGIADPSIWDESRGRDGTVITMMEREGVYFSKGKNDRLSGKMQVHYRLAFDDNGIPMMYVFDTCRQFIRTLPNLVYSTTHPEDIDTTQEDHDYDAMRYFLMENPIKSRDNSVDAPIDYLYENPLNL